MSRLEFRNDRYDLIVNLDSNGAMIQAYSGMTTLTPGEALKLLHAMKSMESEWNWMVEQERKHKS